VKYNFLYDKGTNGSKRPYTVSGKMVGQMLIGQIVRNCQHLLSVIANTKTCGLLVCI